MHEADYFLVASAFLSPAFAGSLFAGSALAVAGAEAVAAGLAGATSFLAGSAANAVTATSEARIRDTVFMDDSNLG